MHYNMGQHCFILEPVLKCFPSPFLVQQVSNLCLTVSSKNNKCHIFQTLTMKTLNVLYNSQYSNPCRYDDLIVRTMQGIPT